jgi:RNA polymerase sigma-70 factor (ECF subfamily)
MTTTVVAMSTPATGVPDTDGALVARLAAGDDHALGHLYDRYGSLVYGLARRVTGSSASAEEITQEVFVQLWEHADRFDAAKGSLRAFLGAITHRRAVDWVRSESRRRDREARTAQDSATGQVATVVDITTGLAAQDTAARVRAAVETLPLEQREAVVLAYFGGLTFREVAARLGLPEGTAKSRLRLALGKLSAVLTAEGVTSWT